MLSVIIIIIIIKCGRPVHTVCNNDINTTIKNITHVYIYLWFVVVEQTTISKI